MSLALSDLKSQIAAFHRKTVAAFNSAYMIDSIDLLTPAINAAKRKAQSVIDFERNKVNGDLDIDGTTLTGDLDDTTLADTATLVTVKRIQHVLLPVSDGFIPIEFLTDATLADRIKRQFGRSAYDASLTVADYGIGETTPYAWQQGKTLAFGPSTQFSGAFTARLNMVQFLPDYVDGNAVTVTLSVASPNAQTFTAYGGTLNGSPIYFGNGMALWRNSAGTNWYVTIAKAASINVEPPAGDYYQLTTTSTSPAGTYTEHASGTPTCVVGTPTGVVTDFIMENGFRFLLWESILQTNRFIKSFAPKEEGNLDEAVIADYAADALSELSQWNASISLGTTNPAGIPRTGK